MQSSGLKTRPKGLVKEATEEPLHSVDFDKPFHLFVDASQHTVSSAMTQIGDGKHLPIAFSSTKLNDTQKKWAIIEKKAFAVLVALQKYRHWLFCGLTVVYCDHNPLSYLTESAPKSAKLMRWALALQEYSILFKYHPGHKNVVADCLSRLES